MWGIHFVEHQVNHRSQITHFLEFNTTSAVWNIPDRVVDCFEILVFNTPKTPGIYGLKI